MIKRICSGELRNIRVPAGRSFFIAVRLSPASLIRMTCCRKNSWTAWTSEYQKPAVCKPGPLLSGLYLFPESVIKIICFCSQIPVNFRIVQSIRIRENIPVVLIFRIQKLKSRFVGGRIGDVFKIFLCDIGAAQEVDPCFCIFLISGIPGDNPGIDP